MRILSSIGVSRLRLRFCLGWLPCWPNQARHLLLLLAPGCSVFTQVDIEMLKPLYHCICYNQCLCVVNQSLSNEVCVQSFLKELPCFFSGYDIFERQPVKDSLVSVPDTATGLGTPPLRLGCFYMLVFVPITCALLQLAAWSRFTLHGRKLQGIKTLRQGSQQGHLIDVKAIWTEKKWPDAAHRHFSNHPPHHPFGWKSISAIVNTFSSAERDMYCLVTTSHYWDFSLYYEMLSKNALESFFIVRPC